jgi:hypothetical protein
LDKVSKESASMSKSLSSARSALLLCVCVVPCSQALAAPANDAFASRIAVTGFPATVAGSNVGATAQAGEPDHAGELARASVWWSWRAPANAQVEINTFDSNFDTILAVYTGGTLTGLTVVAENDDGGADVQSQVRFAAQANVDYKIAVDGFDGEQGTIHLSILSASLPPSNDNFAGAIALTGMPVSAVGSNVAATAQASEPDHAGEPATASVWWSWRAPSGGPVEINTFGSDFDTLLAVYTGTTVGALGAVAANDEAGGGSQSQVRFAAQSNALYRIAVDGFFGEQGSILLNIVPGVAPPPNDNFANAVALAGLPVSAAGSNVAATGQTGEPDHAGDLADGSVWWRWTSPLSGLVQIDTYGSGLDTLLGVYTGTAVNALGEIASNDNAGGDLQSKVQFLAVSSVTYRIAVDGLFGDEGPIVLNILASVAPPPNDAFASRIAIAGLPATAFGSNVAATAEAGEPDHAGSLSSATVWWSWTASSNDYVEVNTYGSAFDTVLGVYTGTAVDALTEIASSDDVSTGDLSRVVFATQAGEVYAIAVDGWLGAEGDIVVHIEPSIPPPLNDAFGSRALLMDLPAGDVGNNELATAELDEPDHAGDPAAASLWWTWYAPTTTMVYVDSNGSANGTRLGVYTGISLLDLVPVDGVRWNGRLRFVAQEGTAYQVAVDSIPGLEGDVALSVYEVTNPMLSGLAQLASNALRIGWTGYEGEIYDVSSATDLAQPAWSIETSDVASATTAFVDLPADPAATSRFYRVDMNLAPR